MSIFLTLHFAGEGEVDVEIDRNFTVRPLQRIKREHYRALWLQSAEI